MSHFSQMCKKETIWPWDLYLSVSFDHFLGVCRARTTAY